MNRVTRLSLLFTLLPLACAGVFAAEQTIPGVSGKTRTDAVDHWGAWELGIEPSAGPQPVTGDVLNLRSPNIQFRPNDNASYRPAAIEQTENLPLPVMPPAPLPVIPPGTAHGTPGTPPPTGDPRGL